MIEHILLELKVTFINGSKLMKQTMLKNDDKKMMMMAMV